MTTVTVEITKLRRVIATVDVEKYCQLESDTRNKFIGSDVDFVKHSLNVIGSDVFEDAPFTEDDSGINAEVDYDDIEYSFARTY